MPESPDYLSLFRSFVPEETPEQKATRLLRERQDRIPTITPVRTAEQELEEYVQKTGGVEGYAQQVVGGQQAFDAAAGQLAAEEARAASGMENVGKFTSSPLLSSTGSLQDVAQLYNKPVESMLKSTGLPQVGGFAGEAVGQLAQDVSGTQADLPGIGRSIGESVPRMVAGGLTGGLGMAADVGLEALAETGDPLSAAGQAGLTGLTMGAAGAGGRAGERMVADWLTKQIVPRPAGLADQLLNRQVVNEALTGVLPKVGAGVGAATAAGGVMEAARQVQEGPSNPFTAENVFNQTANAVVFGGIHAAGALKSPRNLEAQSRLQSWFQDYAKAETAQRRGAQTEFNTDVRARQARPLIEESLSGTDRHPEARQNWWVTTMDKAAQTTDPVARATAVTEMADQLVSTKDLNRVVLTAGALSKTTPPETLPAMVDVAKRYNELRSYMFRMLDEQAAGGADVPSAEGLKQMERQKDIPEMNLEWLKSKFGDNVERTLTGDDSQAFRILGQQVTNQVAILARHGREARARRLTTESIAAPDESASNAEDAQVTAGFVASVNSIPVKEIRDKLAERYLHHEEHDQRYGKGETDKFMEEITDVVTKITEGKTPEQIAALDWANVSAQVERRVVQLNEAGEEIRPIVSKETKLSDYIAKNDAEEYVKKIYGRPNRSQRELLAQEGQDLTEVVGAEDKVPVPAADEANWQYDLGQEAPGTQSVEATIPEVKGAGKAPKGLYDPALDKPAEASGLDTEEMARQMKANIESMDDRKAWTTLAPELVTARGTVDARKREAIQPFAKQVVAAVLELGTGRKARGEQTGEGVGPAGLALLQAKGMPEMTFEKYRAWMDELMNARVNPKYRENLVKRLIGPVTPKVTLGGGERSAVTGTEVGFVNHIVQQFNKALDGTEVKGPQFQVGSTGQINGKGVVRAIQKWAPPEIFEYYKERGIEKFAAGKVTGDEFKQWLEQNTPKAEVKLLVPQPKVEGNVRAEAQHKLETLGFRVEDGRLFDPSSGEELSSGDRYSYGNDTSALIDKFYNAEIYTPKSDAATGRYGVEPKTLENMPGAVDMLLRVPTKAAPPSDSPLLDKYGRKKEGELFHGPHFGDSDVNVLASVRGYMETLPSGEKVFHVFELQSDWGQKISKEKADPYLQKLGKKYRTVLDHPLLTHYETLALKTAIQHARAQGATRIAISDGETAMMTEGHDRQPLSQWILHYSGSSDRVVAKNSEGERHEFANYVEAESWVSAHPPRPKQDTGMRAAYDERLPAIMRKLTNDRGRSENFGQHVKGTSPVFNKDTITARSYDITKPNPLEQRLFSAVGGPVPTGVKSLPGLGASNTGAGSADLHRVLTTHFLKLGYSPVETAMFVTKGQQILQNFSKEVQFAPLDKPSAYRELTLAQEKGQQPIGMEQAATLGAYFETKYTKGQPLVAMAIAHEAGLLPKELAVWQSLATVTHELTHDVQFRGGEFGPYSSERNAAWRQMEAVAKTYNSPQKAQLLKLALQAVIPEKFLYDKTGKMHDMVTGLVTYGSSGRGAEEVPAYEFVSTFSEIIGLGIVTNGAGTKIRPEDVFNSLPTEAALFAKGEFRNFHDNLGALVEAIKDPLYLAGSAVGPVKNSQYVATQMKWLVEQTAKLVKSQEPMQSLKKAQDLMTALEGKNWSGPMTEIVLEAPKASAIPVAEFSKSKQAVTVTQDLLFGPQDWHKTESTEPPMDDKYAVTFEMPPPKVPKVTQAELGFPEEPSNRKPQLNIGGFWKWAGLFQQTMLHMDKRGLPLAQDVGKAFLGLMPAQQRISIGIWKPFMVTDGKFNPNSPLMSIRRDDTMSGRRDNKLVNDLLQWQQRNEKTALEQRPDGSWALTTEATAAGYGDAFGHVPPRVAGTLLGMQEVGRNMGQQLLSSRMQSTAFRVAKLLMASQPKELLPLEYDRTLEAAGMIVRGMVFDQQATIAQGLQVFTQPQRDATVKLLQGGLVEQLKQLNKMVTTRSDWWATEQRPGSHLVVSYKGDKKHTDGAYSMREAQKMQKDLADKGFTDIEIVSKAEKAKVEQFDSPEGILHRYMEMEQQAMEEFVTKNPANLTPEQLALIETYAPQAGAAVGEMLTKRGTNVYLKQRRDVPTAYGLDYVDATREYVSRIAGTIARQMTQQQVDLILSDARLKGQDEFKTLVKENLQAALTPSSEWQRAASSAVSSYFLAANLSSAVVNGFDTVSSLPESLLSVGGTKYGMRHAMGDYARGVSDMIRFVIEGKENQVMLQQAKVKMQRGVKLTPEETKVWALQRAYEMKLLDRGQMQEIAEDTDIKALAARAFGTNQVFPSAIDMAKDPVYRVLQMSMVLPRMVHAVNNEVAFFAGLSQAVDAGMGPQAALDHANRVRVLATFGGGKANPTGAMGSVAGAPVALSVVRLGATMQSYAFGLVSKYVSHASVMLDQDPNLTPLAKKQARQGFAHLLASHLALSGILGLGGVAAAMTLLQKYFNVQAEAGVRKGITATASVMTDDPSVQGMVTELAMNGAANQLFGAAIGQRVGMQNILGMSSYEGFNLLDVVPGAAAGVLSNVVKGLGYASEGQWAEAAHSLVPGALKNATEMAGNMMKFGDVSFRAPNGQRIFTPTPFQKGVFAAGFQPEELTRRRTMSRLLVASDKAQKKEQDRLNNEAALQMLKGNFAPAKELQQVANTASFPRTVEQATGTLKNLADRASVLNSPQDPLASVSYAASPEARRIVQTFPAGTRTPASEVDRAKTRIQLEAQAGVPVDVGTATEEMKRALLVEEAMKKGMTRAEALKWVGLVTGK